MTNRLQTAFFFSACEDSRCSMSTWLEAVGNSGWLKHVHSVLQVSRFIANVSFTLN